MQASRAERGRDLAGSGGGGLFSRVRVSADVNMHEVCYERESVIEERCPDRHTRTRTRTRARALTHTHARTHKHTHTLLL